LIKTSIIRCGALETEEYYEFRSGKVGVRTFNRYKYFIKREIWKSRIQNIKKIGLLS
jgi:hypothetical protein